VDGATQVGPVITAVDDSGDPRLADYRALTDVDLRLRTEPADGLFIGESTIVIERAIRAGYPLRSVLVGDRLLPTIRERVPDGVPIYVGSAALLKAVTGFHVHRGALASFARRPLLRPQDVLAGASRIALLEDVNTHTNLGSIFRCVAALGIDGVLLSPSCTDPLYRRSIRVSMGAVFTVPYARFATWPQPLETLRDSGFRILALSPDGAGTLDGVRLAPGDRAALLLGAEGPGLTSAAMAYAEGVRIPMSSGIDSLNVAAAAAIACYVLADRG
jgi:tRNA G18 (ribose-2'-O)-methylase SpoU